MVQLRQWLTDGAIGQVVSLAADHGQFFPFDPDHRLYNPLLAGGALLDLGVYPVSWVVDLVGLPDAVRAVGELTPTAVDGQVSISLNYPRTGVQATALTTLWAKTPTIAWVAGSEGQIFLPGDFYQPGGLVLQRRDGQRIEWSEHSSGRGYEYELAEVARRVSAGQTASPLMPPDQSVAIMGLLDQIRTQIGVVYPGESAGQ
jgi:predicted dehydrogenase